MNTDYMILAMLLAPTPPHPTFTLSLPHIPSIDQHAFVPLRWTPSSNW